MSAKKLHGDKRTVLRIAKRLHAGETWNAIAKDLDANLMRTRQFYRPKVVPIILQWMPPEEKHGQHVIYMAGCRCEPCRAEHALYINRSRSWAKGNPDVTEERLREIARRRMNDEPWESIAESYSMTAKFCRMTYRQKIAPFIREMIDEVGFPHGSRTGYVRGCRKECCQKPHRDAYHDRVLRRRRGQLRIPIDATYARRHIVMLTENGMGLRRIEELSGVARGTLQRIRNGAPRIQEETQRKILAVDPKRVTPGARVPAGPTNFYIQQLLEAGWTKTAIARALGSKGKTPALQLRPDYVTARSAAKVKALWEEHQRKEGLRDAG